MKKTFGKSKGRNANSNRPFSSILVDGPDRAPSRAMLYPVGFKPEDFQKPIIGIASIPPWRDHAVPLCGMDIDQLALVSEKGAKTVPRSRERERVVADRVRVVG